MDSDIALVQLTEPLEFSHVRPACLPEKEEKVEASRVCVITGWGIQNEGMFTSPTIALKNQQE